MRALHIIAGIVSATLVGQVAQAQEMVFVSGGTFEMGDSFDESGSDALPVHAVYLSPYSIDTYEVTNQQYADGLNWAYAQGGLITVTSGVVYKAGSGTSYPYCDTTTSSSYSRITWNGSTFGVVSGKEDHPMVMVSWYGSVAYCNWRSAMEGKPLCYELSTWTCNFGVDGYRLPTEAEWEKAAGWDPVEQRHFRFGEHTDGCGYACLDGQRANYWNSGDPFETGDYPWTTPVGYYDGTTHGSYTTQNAQSYYGCYDMSGNVLEWCHDWYLSTYYSSSPGSNPTGPGTGTGRVLRGGDWYYLAYDCHSAYRTWYWPDGRVMHFGFRCALGTPEGSQPPEMVFVPGGSFEMGDSFGEGDSDELPVHTVYLSPYYIDKYEVTNAQYAAGLNWAWAQGGLIDVIDGMVYKYDSGTSYFYSSTTSGDPGYPHYADFSRITWNGSTFGVVAGKQDHPMLLVSWYGSVAYCNWRSAMAGKPLCYDLSTWTCNFGVDGYRLPTEAEWEKAAGWDPTQQRHFRFGEHTDGCGYNCLDGQRANYWTSGDPYEVSPLPYPTPVGFYNGELHYKADFGWPSSETTYQTQDAQSYYGCYDMSGNVWEWCHDWYLSTYYSSSPGSNPTGPGTGTGRVLRGSTWTDDPSDCRSANRVGRTPDSHNIRYGFRCALGTPEENQPPVPDAGGPYSGVVGAPITFDASNSYDPDGSIVAYRWDWDDDGTWDTPWLPALYWHQAYDDDYHGLAKLQVQDDGGAVDEDTAQVDVYPPSGDNDDCADSIAVGEGSIPFSTIGATTDGPSHAADCQYDGQTAYDIWYHFAPPATGFYTIAVSADYDCDLVIYELQCSYPCDACDCADAILVNCNDDAYWEPDPDQLSMVAVYLRSNKCYKIRIGSRDEGTPAGTGVLSIEWQAADWDALEELFAAELRGLRRATHAVMDVQLETAAEKFAEVMDALQAEPGDVLLFGYGIATMALTAAASSAVTAGDVATYLTDLGMDPQVAQNLASLITFEYAIYGEIALGVADTFIARDVLAQSVSDWVEGNLDLLETGSVYQIKQGLLNAVKDTHAWGESGDLDYAQFQGDISGRVDALIAQIESGVPVPYPIWAVNWHLDDLTHAMRDSVDGERWLVPIREPLAADVLGSPRAQFDAVDAALDQLGVSETVGVVTTIAGLGLAVGKVAAAIFSWGLGAVALDVAVFGVGAVGAANTVLVGIPTQAEATNAAAHGIQAAEGDCAALGRITSHAAGYLSDFDAVSEIPSEPQVEWSVSIPDQQIGWGDTVTEFQGTLTALNYGDDMISVVAVALVLPTESGAPQWDATPAAIVANDRVELSPGQELQFDLAGSSLIASDPENVYLAKVYLYAGPAVAPYLADPLCRMEFFTITRGSKARSEETTWALFGSGSLNEAEAVEYDYDAAPDLWSSDLVLFHAGGDLDLHVYDDQHRHVGRNYATGAVDCEIPEAVYTGPETPMETVRLPSSAGQSYEVRVVAFQASRPESFTVGAIEIPVRPAILSVLPPVLDVVRDVATTETIEFNMFAREVGAQEDYVGLSASATDLVSSGGQIDSTNISFDVPSSTIPAGEVVAVGVTIDVPPDSPTGTYTGSFEFGLEPVTVPVTLSLVSLVPGDLDGDGDVDLDDFGIFAACTSGPGETIAPPGCDPVHFSSADSDSDSDVDLFDFAVFQAVFTGSL